MTIIHISGFPRIGRQRELKFALEAFWRGEISLTALENRGHDLRDEHWRMQQGLDWLPVGDFALYDGVLEHTRRLGALPARVRDLADRPREAEFLLARGGQHPETGAAIEAAEMTKWFDTNYHYLVPELDRHTIFSLQIDDLLGQIRQAQTHQAQVKPVLIGPVTWLWLAKSVDGTHRLEHLPALLAAYGQWLEAMADAGVHWVQLDEPILATDLDDEWQHALRVAYHQLRSSRCRILLATYFGHLGLNRYLAATLPTAGLHIDAVRGRADVEPLLGLLPAHKVLSLGVIDGRNVWRTPLAPTLDWLEPVHQRLGDRLWLAPSCSLLHVPVDLELEPELDATLRHNLAFARQKLAELQTLRTALVAGRHAIEPDLADNARHLRARQSHPDVHDHNVRNRLRAVTPAWEHRASAWPERAALQARRLRLPSWPTTTIGSFPQTADIRESRRQFRAGEIDRDAYDAAMRQAIAHCIDVQEALGLDVLVHGEAERNDMVEYFAEHLEGFAFTRHGWVQSYGSRCVKPPILYGDIRRPHAITRRWVNYAQSLTARPVKGMLTGPVTLLNWSFVRDDQPRRDTCRQLALAIRDEVVDLEQAGVAIIQIDEAALREGLPLRRSEWDEHLDWAVSAFRLTASGVSDATQIHTHMCYSDFHDILPAIAAMDADVITIETARSHRELLRAFRDFAYPNAIGPGVYDIHSPRIPEADDIVALLREAARAIPAERLWVNPDCGLKTRRWEEVEPALRQMVSAAHTLRAENKTEHDQYTTA